MQWKSVKILEGNEKVVFYAVEKSVFVMVYSEKNDFKRYTYVLLKAMWYAFEKFCGMQWIIMHTFHSNFLKNSA